MAVPGFPRTWHVGTRYLLLLRRRFQMRIEQRDLGVQPRLYFRKFDLGLDLDLLMDSARLFLLLLPFQPIQRRLF